MGHVGSHDPANQKKFKKFSLKKKRERNEQFKATGVQMLGLGAVIKRLYANIKDFSLILFGSLGHLPLAYINN